MKTTNLKIYGWCRKCKFHTVHIEFLMPRKHKGTSLFKCKVCGNIELAENLTPSCKKGHEDYKKGRLSMWWNWKELTGLKHKPKRGRITWKV